MKRLLVLKKLSALVALLLTGCSVTIVYAPKSVDIDDSYGVGVYAELSGSDLKDFKASQESKADGTVTP